MWERAQERGEGRRRGVTRRLVLTGAALLERRPASYEVAERRQLAALAAVVRFAAEPTWLGLEWTDGAPASMYVLPGRDALLAALLDAAQVRGTVCIHSCADPARPRGQQSSIHGLERRQYCAFKRMQYNSAEHLATFLTACASRFFVKPRRHLRAMKIINTTNLEANTQVSAGRPIPVLPQHTFPGNVVLSSRATSGLSPPVLSDTELEKLCLGHMAAAAKEALNALGDVPSSAAEEPRPSHADASDGSASDHLSGRNHNHLLNSVQMTSAV